MNDDLKAAADAWQPLTIDDVDIPALLTPGAVSFPDHTPTAADLDRLIHRDPDLDRIDEDHADTRRGRLVRAGRMQLLHGGRSFLRRRSIETRWFGILLHSIDGPDPGKDLHDHPWPFVSIVLSGGYTEEVCDTREAPYLADIAESLETDTVDRGFTRSWFRGSVHRIRLTEAHRIIAVRPGTRTLVLRGPKSQSWGFYLPMGWVDQRRYDYRTRRPVTEHR